MGLAQRLHKKGWSKEEIDHALMHMDRARTERSPKRVFFEESLYWFAMLLLAAGNVVIVYYLIPFLESSARALNWPASVNYTIVATLGIVVGILFAHLLHDLADLEPKHHSFVLFLASLTVAVSAVLVGQYSVSLAATFATVFVLYYSFVWWSRGR